MSSYKQDPYWITTRYPGHCASCQGTIPAGCQAFYYPKGKHIYCKRDECGGRASAEFEAMKHDEAVYNREWI